MKRGTPRAWLKSPRVRSAPPSRDVEKDLELEAKRFREIAPRLGWCGACGHTVDEAHGILHGEDCPWLPAERRRVG